MGLSLREHALTLSVLATGTLLSSAASGTIFVSWVSTGGIDDPTVPGVAADLSPGALAQLLWSPDGAIDPIDPLDPLTPSIDDILLKQEPIPAPGGSFAFGPDTFMGEDFGLGADGLLGGTVYTRVFNTPAPGVGDFYDESTGLFPLTDQDPVPGSPDVLDFAPFGIRTLEQQIPVPEPSTAVLLLLGVLGLCQSRGRNGS